MSEIEKLSSCAICSKVESAGELTECPCGKPVCDDCTDNSVYSDQTMCVQCAKEITEHQTSCPHPKFGEPYENDDEQIVAECETCSFAKLIQAVTP